MRLHDKKFGDHRLKAQTLYKRFEQVENNLDRSVMSRQELPRLSEDAVSKQIETKSGRSVLLLKVPSLNLYVISDCNNFGSNWIEVSFSNKVYSTRYLMGENEDLFSVIARRFAQDIIGKRAVFVLLHLPKLPKTNLNGSSFASVSSSQPNREPQETVGR